MEVIMATSNQDKGNKQSTTQSGNQGSTKNRGFASMDPARQREIASEGGKAAHQKGTAHEFTSEEARRAGSMSHGNRQSAESSSGTSSGTRSGASSGASSGNRGAAERGGTADTGGGGKGGGEGNKQS
jgi:hypothetical protein